MTQPLNKCPARYSTIQALQQHKSFQQLTQKTRAEFNTLPAQKIYSVASPDEQFKEFVLPGSSNKIVIYQHQKQLKTHIYWLPEDRMKHLTSGPTGHQHLLTQCPQWKIEEQAITKLGTKGIKWLVEKLSQAADNQEYLGVGEININSSLQPLFFKEWAKAVQINLSTDFLNGLMQSAIQTYQGFSKGLWMDLHHVQDIAEQQQWTHQNPGKFGSDRIYLEQGQLRWQFNDRYDMAIQVTHPEELMISIAPESEIHHRWTPQQLQTHQVAKIEKGQWTYLDPEKALSLIHSVNYLTAGLQSAGHGTPEYPIDVKSYAYQMAFVIQKTKKTEAEILLDIFFNPASSLYFKYRPQTQRMETLCCYRIDILAHMTNPSIKTPLQGSISLPKTPPNSLEHPLHPDWVLAAERLHHHLKGLVQERTPVSQKQYVEQFEQMILSVKTSNTLKSPKQKRGNELVKTSHPNKAKKIK